MNWGHTTSDAYLAEEFEMDAAQNFLVGKEAAVISTVPDLTEKVSARSGVRRAAPSHHKLGAWLPAYEGLVGVEHHWQGGRRVLTYLRTADSCDSPHRCAHRMPPISRGSPRLSDGGVGNMCSEQQRGLAVGTRRAAAAAAARDGRERERDREEVLCKFTFGEFSEK